MCYCTRIVYKTFSKYVEGLRGSRQCQKPQKLGIGMAVCRQDRAYKDYTSNRFPTYYFMLSLRRLQYKIARNSTDGEEKKDVGMGLPV